jgi:two-component system response regulator AtoC
MDVCWWSQVGESDRMIGERSVEEVQPTVLVVDDDEKILFAFREVFRKEGYRSLASQAGGEALRMVTSDPPDLVFMDISMPKLNGLEVLAELRKQSPTLPVVLITGYGTMQTAVKAMQLGAFEYLTKPLDVQRVREVARRALASSQASQKVQKERGGLTASTLDRHELIGNSPAMQEVYKLIGSISTTSNHSSVLILGESGTGKELVARAIHAYGSRAAEPFIGINCTGLPETLLESELFGYEKGAFTGAAGQKLGKFEIARFGTIFLDEIGTLPLALQQKLLRVLQEREFERLGGNTPVHVEARFIAATNKDLLREVKEKSFREDLFYRLNVVTIHLPPLRERRGDIPLLASHFLTKYNQQHRRSLQGFSEAAMDLLSSYSYPGNVRELENLIERAVMITRGDVLLADSLGGLIHRDSQMMEAVPITSPVFSRARTDLLQTFEKQFITEQLLKHRGNVTAAARDSHMTRQNFQRLMKKFEIHAEQFRRSGG